MRYKPFTPEEEHWDRLFIVWPTLVLIGLFFPSMTTPLLILAGTILLVNWSTSENRR